MREKLSKISKIRKSILSNSFLSDTRPPPLPSFFLSSPYLVHTKAKKNSDVMKIFSNGLAGKKLKNRSRTGENQTFSDLLDTLKSFNVHKNYINGN